MFIVNVSKNVISYSNPFILIDFEQMDFNWGHACDMSSQVKYALFRHKQIHVSRPHMGDMASEKCINSKAYHFN